MGASIRAVSIIPSTVCSHSPEVGNLIYRESTETTRPPQQSHQQPLGIVVSGGTSFIPPPIYIPSGGTPVSLEQQQQFEALNPKRPRHTTESTPSPSAPTTTIANPHPPQPKNSAASSSETTSSPSHSPLQFRSASFGQETSNPEEGAAFAVGDASTVATGRETTRADKDIEVAEFLNRHGVNRDAQTADTKWDNILGKFRKVYEWEREGEQEVGKSYFRLSPYERKLHRLPASFDEEVFEELAQFMGPRMRTPQNRGGVAFIPGGDETAYLSLPSTSLCLNHLH
ncbi:unnamed protein product [Fraxinus pennsylvanica]|uniref:Uncharacterized protein n=1 Tax=Fraxinus pennsylvanica TaxID=56036 RepID=A0AAD1ZLZ7_9LAMI|nr:unnamed protein product [Fraxinus pennsylvanica]